MRVTEIARWGAGEPAALVTALWWSRDHRWLAARIGSERVCLWNAATHEPWGELAPHQALALNHVEFVCGSTAALLWTTRGADGPAPISHALQCVSLCDPGLPKRWTINAPAAALELAGLREALSRIVVSSERDGWWALDRVASSQWTPVAAAEAFRSTVRMRDDDTVDLLTARAWVRARLERDRVVVEREYFSLHPEDRRLRSNELGVLAHNADSTRAWLRRNDGAVFETALPAHDRHLSRLAREAAVYVVSSERGRCTLIDLEAGARVELAIGEAIEDVELSPDAARLAVAGARGDVRVFEIERNARS